MRDFKGMKRQRGRNRGGGGKPQQNANRAFESNGPEGIKVRGAAQHVFERYQQLARDATSSGDRVLAENYLQHAEHYFRVVRAVQPQKPASEIIGRDNFASGFDIDFEDESGAQAAAVESPEGGAEANGEDGQPQEAREGRRDREDRFRDRDDRQRDRDDRQRDERPRDRDRFRDRDDRPRDRDRDRWRDRPERDPLAVVEPEASPLVNAEAEAGSPILRGEDGAESHAPAFLQGAAPAEEPRTPKPRRRRAPRSFEGGEGEAAPSNETEEA
ncbi:MAG: DUF4167 domain-containing protein [Caulobacteraceae bacterium]|nr:DUF4167 domain-containing protein [Caulobacteraceae bacterium]